MSERLHVYCAQCMFCLPFNGVLDFINFSFDYWHLPKHDIMIFACTGLYKFNLAELTNNIAYKTLYVL